VTSAFVRLPSMGGVSDPAMVPAVRKATSVRSLAREGNRSGDCTDRKGKPSNNAPTISKATSVRSPLLRVSRLAVAPTVRAFGDSSTFWSQHKRYDGWGEGTPPKHRG